MQPHYLHVEMAVEALSRDIHVLCEKPCAMNREELAKIKMAQLMSTCVTHCMEFPEGIKRIRILAASQHVKKMVVTLLGDVTYQTEQVHDAQCYREKSMNDR